MSVWRWIIALKLLKQGWTSTDTYSSFIILNLWLTTAYLLNITDTRHKNTYSSINVFIFETWCPLHLWEICYLKNRSVSRTAQHSSQTCGSWLNCVCQFDILYLSAYVETLCFAVSIDVSRTDLLGNINSNWVNFVLNSLHFFVRKDQYHLVV